MPNRYRRHLALGLARALLAGPPAAESLHARAVDALGRSSPALRALVGTVARGPLSGWPWRSAEVLAEQLMRAEAFHDLFHEPGGPPRLCSYILRPPRQRPPPLGLHTVDWPQWPTPGDLAQALGLDPLTLDWLCAVPPRRRKLPLQVQHYRFALIPKRDGGLRLLEAPRPRLKAVQRALLDQLLARVPPHEAACGFLRGASVRDHAERHAGQPVLLRFDLKDFFGSVSGARIHALFATLGYPVATARALTALTTCRTPEAVLQRLRDDGAWSWPEAQRLRDAHLPQGAPSSPALANLCCFRLDLRLQGLADSLQGRYSRYADDLVLSGPPILARRAAELQALVGVIVREEGFSLNHRKTHVATQAAQQRICGIVVNARPNLPRNEFDRLKATLHRHALTQAPVPANELDVLRGRVSWARQLNPAKAQRLERLLRRLTPPAGTGDVTPERQPR
jgi:hypothetical protein